MLIHLPPNLAVEVDISRSSTIKLGIYEALGIGEVWRFHGEGIQILVLAEGSYRNQNANQALPHFPLE